MANCVSLLLLFSIYLLTPCSAAETSSDLVAAESIASSKTQGAAKYGYPYMIAPTLGPRIEARSDDDESREAVSAEKSYGSRISKAEEDVLVKKSSQKKSKTPYGATRRQDEENSPAENQRFRSYREPKYRNFEELEDSFQPRRIDINIPYSQYDYTSKFAPKPSLSPRDPFLSPSKEPIDAFYPSSHKAKNYPTSSYGIRNQGRPTYGAGSYDDSHLYHGKDIPSGSSYRGPSPGYPSSSGLSSGYPSSGGGGYGYQEYAIKSNEPIMGSIRKKLLDYAGASDLYEGEPDYLKEVARNKYKYENIGNDYYAYGGPAYKDSYRDFPYVESKVSMIKKSRRV